MLMNCAPFLILVLSRYAVWGSSFAEEVDKCPVACFSDSAGSVCGRDGQTHVNSCIARCRGVEVLHDGECVTSLQLGLTHGTKSLFPSPGKRRNQLEKADNRFSLEESEFKKKPDVKNSIHSPVLRPNRLSKFGKNPLNSGKNGAQFREIDRKSSQSLLLDNLPHVLGEVEKLNDPVGLDKRERKEAQLVNDELPPILPPDYFNEYNFAESDPCTRNCIYPGMYSAVCGTDNQTYVSECEALCKTGTKPLKDGPCDLGILGELGIVGIFVSEGFIPVRQYGNYDKPWMPLPGIHRRTSAVRCGSCDQYTKSLVCGRDGETYVNADCAFKCGGVAVAHKGQCGRDSNSNKEIPPCRCPPIFQIVCGIDGRTYISACQAACRKVKVLSEGPCELQSVQQPRHQSKKTSMQDLIRRLISSAAGRR